jgi:hypothetical protein
MPTPIYDIYAEQGAKLEIEFLYEDSNENGVNLTGASGYTHAHMQVRPSTEEISTDVILEVEDDTASVLGVTGYAGEFTLTYDGITGNILLEVDSETMAAVPSGKYFYEIQLVNAINPMKLVRGRFIVEPGAIR